MFGVGLVTLALSLILKGKFAGLTGDAYGAIIEVGEVTSLILAIALLKAMPSWNW
jgi:cobalamin synthase